MRSAEEYARSTQEARRLVEEAEKERARAEALLAGQGDEKRVETAEEEGLARRRTEEIRRLTEKLNRVRQIREAGLAAQARRPSRDAGCRDDAGAADRGIQCDRLSQSHAGARREVGRSADGGRHPSGGHACGKCRAEPCGTRAAAGLPVGRRHAATDRGGAGPGTACGGEPPTAVGDARCGRGDAPECRPRDSCGQATPGIVRRSAGPLARDARHRAPDFGARHLWHPPPRAQGRRSHPVRPGGLLYQRRPRPAGGVHARAQGIQVRQYVRASAPAPAATRSAASSAASISGRCRATCSPSTCTSSGTTGARRTPCSPTPAAAQRPDACRARTAFTPTTTSCGCCRTAWRPMPDPRRWNGPWPMASMAAARRS